jgi:hypothetical protein
MSIGPSIALVTVAVLQSLPRPAVVPFDVCRQSADWTRPSPDIQSKIWNDPRYRDVAPHAYEWSHNFLSVEPDSASLTYHSQNLSGLWTRVTESGCPRRDEEKQTWTEIWALNYHVTGIVLNGLAYLVTVTPQARGYEVIQFHRAPDLSEKLTSLEFLTPDGRTVDRWRESSPSVFVALGR